MSQERMKPLLQKRRYYVTCASTKTAFAKYVYAPTELHARLYACREYDVQLSDVKAHEA